jgi:hypothetical protein
MLLQQERDLDQISRQNGQRLQLITTALPPLLRIIQHFFHGSSPVTGQRQSPSACLNLALMSVWFLPGCLAL